MSSEAKSSKDKQQEIVEDINYEPEVADELSLKIDKLKKQLKECKKQKQEYLDGWQRAQADFINIKKENSEKFANLKKEAVSEVLQGFLPVLDSFDMALFSESWNELDKQWQDGISGIRNSFLETLKSYGVEIYGQEGDEFNPEIHEATEQRKSENFESGKIIAVLQKGYKIGDRVIRPARVVVAL